MIRNIKNLDAFWRRDCRIWRQGKWTKLSCMILKFLKQLGGWSCHYLRMQRQQEQHTLDGSLGILFGTFRIKHLSGDVKTAIYVSLKNRLAPIIFVYNKWSLFPANLRKVRSLFVLWFKTLQGLPIKLFKLQQFSLDILNNLSHQIK